MQKSIAAFLLHNTEVEIREKYGPYFSQFAGLCDCYFITIGAVDQSVEQAIFKMSSDLPIPNLIFVTDYIIDEYQWHEIFTRCRYHFPTSKLCLIAKKPENYSHKLFQESLEIDYIIQEQQLKFLDTIVNFESSGETKSSILRRQATNAGNTAPKLTDQFLKIRIDTPVAPKTIPETDTVNFLLSKNRKIGRVLLVIPSQENVYGTKIKPAYPALGVLYCAAILDKAGHKVEIIDQDADNFTDEQIVKLIENNKYDVIGFTSTTPTHLMAVKACTLIKTKYPRLKIIYGGIHATVDYADAIKEKCFDYIAIGEAECTTLELVDAIIAGSPEENFKQIKGIIFKSQAGAFYKTPSRDLVPDLDDYPFPAYHLLKDVKAFHPPDASYSSVFSVMVSRGCPGQCTYCQTKNIFGRRTRFRTPRNVIEEIRHLVATYDAKEIHFMDDVLTANKSFVYEFCKILKNEPYKLKLEVPNGLRADMIDEEILKTMHEVGLDNVGFGVETGNEEIAKLIRKGIHKNQTRKAVGIAKKFGLKTWCFFILGLPGDTEETIKETIDFAIELNPKFAKFLILKPFPGSEIYYQLDEKGLIDSRVYSDYGVYTPPVHHLEALSPEKILKLQKYAFRKFYLRPSKIIEHLIEIDSFEKFKAVIRGFLFILMNIFKKSRFNQKSLNLASGGASSI